MKAAADKTAPTPATAAAAPRPNVGPQAVFDAWVNSRTQTAEATGTKTLQAKSVDHYRMLWRKWVEWLTTRPGKHLEQVPHRWAHATVDDVEEFVHKVKDKLGGKRPVKVDGHRANLTRRLYWAVLRDVYGYAAGQGLCEANPTLGAKVPEVQAQDRRPQYIEHELLMRLRDPEELAQLVRERTPQWLASRDRAAIALVAHMGLTSSELQQLRVQDLRMADGRQASLDGFASSQKPRLDVNGRSLDIPKPVQKLLSDWLEERAQVVQRLRALAVEDARTRRVDPSEVLAPEAPTAPLLLAREPVNFRPSPIPLPSVSHIFAHVLKDIRRKQIDDKEISKVDYRACGPAAIRNSVIRDWLLRLGPAAASELSGVKRVAERHDVLVVPREVEEEDIA